MDVQTCHAKHTHTHTHTTQRYMFHKSLTFFFPRLLKSHVHSRRQTDAQAHIPCVEVTPKRCRLLLLLQYLPPVHDLVILFNMHSNLSPPPSSSSAAASSSSTSLFLELQTVKRFVHSDWRSFCFWSQNLSINKQKKRKHQATRHTEAGNSQVHQRRLQLLHFHW